MPDAQPIPDPAEQAREIEREVLYLLTNRYDNQPLWTLEDLACELHEHDILSYVESLQNAGLVRRTSDGHVFASRAAVRQAQLID